MKRKQIYYNDEEYENINIYDVKIVNLGTHLVVKKYSYPIVRYKEGAVKIKKFTLTDEDIIDICLNRGISVKQFHEYKKESKLRSVKENGSVRVDSAMRSFSLLHDYAMKNRDLWKSFITLTFASPVIKPKEAYKFLKNYKEYLLDKFGFKLTYLGVPELQQAGTDGHKRIHYHFMTNIVPGSEMMPLRALKWVTYKRNPLDPNEIPVFSKLEYYDIPGWPYGYSTGFDLNMTDANFNITAYLAKYFWKNKEKNEDNLISTDEAKTFFDKKKVLRSRDLELPDNEFHMSGSSSLDQYAAILSEENIVFQYDHKRKVEFDVDYKIIEYKMI